MTFVVQIRHNGDYLDLGSPDRTLMIFQCDRGTCESWRPLGGANDCLLVDDSDLNDAETIPPKDVFDPSNEAWALAWVPAPEKISPEQLPAFFSEEEWLDLDDEITRNVVPLTKLGGAPSWIQKPEMPGGDWQFVGQISFLYGFVNPPTKSMDWIEQLDDHEEALFRSRGLGPNFGDCGMMYIFKIGTGPETTFAAGWQCY